MVENKSDTSVTRKSPKGWCFSTYFAEGFPYSVIRVLSSVFFTDIGMKERYIGYLNFLGIPWNFKFLWAPFVDLFGTSRGWMIVLQGLIALFTMGLAAACWVAPSLADPARAITAFSILLVVLAFLSATNDIAIDGYYIAGIPDKNEQAALTGWRVFAWRLALISVRSGLVALVAWMVIVMGGGDKFRPWAVAFALAAFTMFLLTVIHFFTLPKFSGGHQSGRTVAQISKEFVSAFSSYLNETPKKLFATSVITMVATLVYFFSIKPLLSGAFAPLEWLWLMIGPALSIIVFTSQLKKQIALTLLFIIFYKIGDEVLFSMGTPFLMRELAVPKAHLAWLAGIVGAIGSIAGTALGGIWIKKVGFKKAIWPLTLIMNVNIMAYVWLAWAKPIATTINAAGQTVTDPVAISIIAAVHAYEQMAAGLGAAVLIVYILRTCNAEFKASHYAVGSAIMSLFSTFFGGLGGRIVESMGYLNMFILAFALTIPAMGLIFFAPMHDEQE